LGIGGDCLSKNKTEKGKMTVEEAGSKGGQKVRKLVAEGKEHEQE
jgi:hypothetical protein